MAKQFYGLSEEDRKVLQRLIDREKKRKSSDPLRDNPDKTFNETTEETRAGLYIAVPAVGFGDIPPLASDDTGWGIGKVSSGMCDICYIDIEEDGAIIPIGHQERVHNLTENVLPSTPFPVAMDRFGRWVALQGGGSAGIWAVVKAKQLVETDFNVRGKYRCDEIEWLEGGTWQVKENGRIFTNCYEASMNSNANIHISKLNVVQLWPVPTVSPSSASATSSEASEEEAAASSGASSSSSNVVEALYVFDKALGGIFNPVHI